MTTTQKLDAFARNTGAATDASGFALFSHGEIGAAHVIAHKMLDTNQIALGHRRLGAWLERYGRVCRGTLSEWTHIQWHMLVFELGLGFVSSALARFERHILPAVDSHAALTDAPSALWRIALAAPQAPELAWQSVLRAAVSSADHPSPFVQMHGLLARAGAGDVPAIDDWLAKSSTHGFEPHQTAVLENIAGGLRSYVLGDFSSAESRFLQAIPRLQLIGGSQAQRELFSQLVRSASREHDALFEHARQVA